MAVRFGFKGIWFSKVLTGKFKVLLTDFEVFYHLFREQCLFEHEIMGLPHKGPDQPCLKIISSCFNLCPGVRNWISLSEYSMIQ